MDRARRLAEVSSRLEGRRLVWFGTRGDDIESLMDLPEFSAALSIIGRYGRRNVVEALSMEELSGVRVDLDTYEIDDEPDHGAHQAFRAAGLRVLAEPSAVITYRPSALVSSLCFARQDRSAYLGMFKDHQAAFEHKPWVESAIRGLGIPAIGWHYVADEDQLETLRLLDDGPVILRKSRTSGGTGFTRVDDPATLPALWPRERDAYVSIAPFIEDGVPVNVGAVVWRDGVTVHPASVQLIGIPGCTRRPFGYCGNDFGAVRAFDDSLEEIERHVGAIGDWLRRHGYLGAYGVDFLLKDGVPLFTEVNPRFQGSTHLSAQISVELDRSCILLDHIAALLGLPCPAGAPGLADYARHADLAHVVVHWLGGEPCGLDGTDLGSALRATLPVLRTDVAAHPAVPTAPGAIVLRVTARQRLTTSGFDLRDDWGAPIGTWMDERLGRPAAARDGGLRRAAGEDLPTATGAR